MSHRVRVLLWHRVPSPEEGAGLEAAYHAVSQALAPTPGLLGSELLVSLGDPERVLVMSEWASLEAFRAWEQGREHRDTTAPLRPWRDHSGRPVEILQVRSAY
ncbi:MAG TPA: antibiotic biosynthesis monooxygenase [Egibacteraceae bacterium]